MSVHIPRKGNRAIFEGVYKITSPSGAVYVGQSWDILARWKSYKSYRHQDQPRLFNSFKKHGAENHKFEIIAWFSAGCSQQALDDYERQHIADLKAQGIPLLNIMEGGRGGRHSEESKRKIGEANRNSKRPDLAAYNRAFKAEQMRGRKATEETKRKIGLAHKGKAWSKGRVQSESERQKRSEITKRFWAKRKALGITGALGS